MIEDLYAPNQQLVRADGSGPAEEGAGGSTPEDPYPKDELDAMTKDQLLDYADETGVTGVNTGMTKDQIKQAIRDAEAGG